MSQIQPAVGLRHYDAAGSKPAVRFIEQAKEKIAAAVESKGSELLIATGQGTAQVSLDLFLESPEQYVNAKPALLVLELAKGESVGIEIAKLSKESLFKALDRALGQSTGSLHDEIQASAAPIISRIRASEAKPGAKAQAAPVAALDKLLRQADVDTLLSKACSRHEGVRKPALAALEALRGKVLDSIKAWPGDAGLKAALTEQLRSYDFGQLAAGKIEQFEDFAPGLSAKIEALIAALPAGQRAGAQDLADSLNAAFELQSVGGLRIKAQRYDALVSLASKTAALPGKAAALATNLAENPQSDPKPLEAIRKEFSQTLATYRETYSVWWNKAPGDTVLEQSRKGLADKQPGVKLLALLQQASDLLGTGLTMRVNRTDLEAQIDQALAKVKGPDRAPLERIVAQYRALRAGMDVQSRIVAVLPDQQAAIERAQAEAKAHPDQIYGVVDRGWNAGKHQGYQVLSYPAGAYEAKATQAGTAGQTLLKVVRTSGGEIKTSGRAKAKALIGNFAPGHVSKIVLEQPKLASRVLEELGQRAKRIAIDNYQLAIDNYKGMSNPNVLLANLIAADQQGNLERVLEGMFAINPHGSQAGEKAVAPVAHQFRLMLADTRKLDEAGKSAEAIARIKAFLASPAGAALKAGVAEVLRALEEARDETAALKDGTAAYELSNRLDFVREELYRECGFGLDPARGVPPLEGPELEVRLAQRGFNSTAEAIFARGAPAWKTGEQVVSIAKTAGMIGLSVGLAVATGGAGSAAVAGGLIGEGTLAMIGTGVAVTMSAASAAQGLSETNHAWRGSQANHAAGMISFEQLKAADRERTLSLMSVVTQLGAGLVTGTATRAINPLSLKATLLTDGGMNVVNGVLNPRTYDADPKTFLVNLVMSCAVSAVTNVAGAAASSLGSRLAASDRVQIVLDQESGQFMLLGAGEEPIPVTPIVDKGGNEGENQLRFRAADGTEFTTGLESTSVQLVERKQPDMLAHVSPATRAEATRLEQLAIARGDSTARRKLYEVMLEDAAGIPDELKLKFMQSIEAQLPVIEAEQAELRTKLANPALSHEDRLKLLARQVEPDAYLSAAMGRVVSKNPEIYTLKGNPIPSTAIKPGDPLTRVVGLGNVYKYMMSKEAHQMLSARGITNEKQFIAQVRAGAFSEQELLAMLDSQKLIAGGNNMGWWATQGNSKATSVDELIIELALSPKDYEGGGIRFAISAEQAQAQDMRKTTAFDGMGFKEWWESPGTVTGTTGGGRSEGVIKPVPMTEATSNGGTRVFFEAPKAPES